MSIYDLLMHSYDWDFPQAIRFLKKFKNIDDYKPSREKGFNKAKNVCSDWAFLSKYKSIKKEHHDIILPSYNKSDLNRFDNIYPESWLSDFIDEQAMWKFEIKFYTLQWKAVIPHYDMVGNLIGIRGRSFLYQDVINGKKYMPIYYGKDNYKHPLKFNLYGLYQNLDTIKKKSKVILFESEKAVLQCESYYPNENFAIALCGSGMSNYQRDLILQLGVSEVFIALDKQYHTELETEADIKEYNQYIKKVENIANRLVNYASVYIVYADDDTLEYKNSPSDKGKEVLEILMKTKHKYTLDDKESKDEV